MVPMSPLITTKQSLASIATTSGLGRSETIAVQQFARCRNPGGLRSLSGQKQTYVCRRRSAARRLLPDTPNRNLTLMKPSDQRRVRLRDATIPDSLRPFRGVTGSVHNVRLINQRAQQLCRLTRRSRYSQSSARIVSFWASTIGSGVSRWIRPVPTKNSIRGR